MRERNHVHEMRYGEAIGSVFADLGSVRPLPRQTDIRSKCQGTGEHDRPLSCTIATSRKCSVEETALQHPYLLLVDRKRLVRQKDFT